MKPDSFPESCEASGPEAEHIPLDALLLRQLRRHDLSLSLLSPLIKNFLLDISRAYSDANHDRLMLERSLELMSAEMLERHAQLKAENARLEELKEKLRLMARYDSLTGLPNRAYLLEELEKFISRSRRSIRRASDFFFAVMFLDLGRFKLVNDSLGHEAGDRLLIETAARLNSCLRPGDVLGRTGGDEFVLILDDLRKPEDAMLVADRIHETLEKPFSLNRHDVTIEASIGITLSGERKLKADRLLREADIAMYRAKKNGGRTAVFDRNMQASIRRRFQIETDLRRALTAGGLYAVYQPIVVATSGRMSGLEALARWNHPRQGLLSPVEFIPVAEESGLIRELDGLILLMSATRKQIWNQIGGPFRINVNLSPQQLRNPGLIDFLENVLSGMSLEAGEIMFELTEGTLIEALDTSNEQLKALRSMGFKLAVDDFGTGYSSLSYLKQFKVDAIKIDRAFIKGLPEDAESVTLVRTIVGMAHGLGLSVTAEGVETKAQYAFLQENGCNELQGFGIARPLPSSEVEDWIKSLA